MSDNNQLGYFAKEVALQLDINPSTLRRWCLELEKAGYTFTRNENNQRIFYESDFKAFRKLKELLNKSISMNNAVHAVISMVQTISQTPTVQQNNGDEARLSVRDLQEIIQQEVKKAMEAEREILLDAIEQKLSNQIEKRDRELMASLKELQETKLLAAATEENKKKWYQFWK